MLAVDVTCTPAEFVEAFRFAAHRSRFLAVARVTAYLCAAVAGAILLAIGNFIVGGFLLALVVVAYLAGERQLSRQAVRAYPSVREGLAFRLQWDAEGFEVLLAGSSVRQAWESLSGWRESRGLFLLYPDADRFLAVPKRCFRSPDEAQAFRTALGSIPGH